MAEREAPKTDDLGKYVEKRARFAGGALVADGHPYLQALDRLEAEGRANGGNGFVSFANYDYLGLCNDPRVIAAASACAKTHGVGASASRLVGGQRMIHDEFERELAEFLGSEDTLTLVSGYMTNASLIGHLLTSRNVIFVDANDHNSIMVGADLSRADVIKFDHNDLDHLERQLREHRHRFERALVVVESLYSMDGDILDLPRLLELKKRFGFWILLDEAHSIGVLGETGRGLTEHWGVPATEIEFIIGTLSKAFGSVGGFIAGRRDVLLWLRFTLPAFVYSVGLPPMVAAAVREALAVVHAEPWRVQKVQANSRYFADGAVARGMDIGHAAGVGIVPIHLGSVQDCMLAAHILSQNGYYAPPIVNIAVPSTRPRIRCFVSASHSKEQMDGLLDTLAATGLVQSVGAKSIRAASQGGHGSDEAAGHVDG